jgi:hypothetical protein
LEEEREAGAAEEDDEAEDATEEEGGKDDELTEEEERLDRETTPAVPPLPEEVEVDMTAAATWEMEGGTLDSG